MKPLLLFFAAITAFGQTAGSAIPFVKSQWFTAGGLPAATQKVCFYLAGTSTPSAPYTTSAINVHTTNPVVLDSAGRADIFLGTISYKIVMLSAASTTTDCITGTLNVLWTEDNIANNSDLLRVALAAGTGAGLIGYQPAGSTESATTVGSLLTRSGVLYDSDTYTPDTFLNACTVAASAGRTLVITAGGASKDLFVPGGTHTCDLWFLAGGKLRVIAGATATFSGNLYCPPTQNCFDTLTNSGAIAVFTANNNTNGAHQSSLNEYKHFYAGGAIPPTSTSGVDTAGINGTLFISEIFIPAHVTLTGISYVLGSVGGTDKVVVALFDSAGNVLANSALDSSVTAGTLATFQRVPFTAPLPVAGPGKYYVGIQFNGNTAKLRTQEFGDTSTVSISQTFNTLVAITPPTSFLTAVGPFCMTY